MPMSPAAILRVMPSSRSSSCSNVSVVRSSLTAPPLPDFRPCSPDHRPKSSAGDGDVEGLARAGLVGATHDDGVDGAAHHGVAAFEHACRAERLDLGAMGGQVARAALEAAAGRGPPVDGRQPGGGAGELAAGGDEGTSGAGLGEAGAGPIEGGADGAVPVDT